MTATQCEAALSQKIHNSWERLRSSDELQTLIGRRELVLQTIENDELDFVV